MILDRSSAWGKLSKNNDKWHSLVGHSIDVASSFEALLSTKAYRSRLSSALGRMATSGDIARLCYLAFIHDIGKASPGFRFKLEESKPVGHIKEILWLLNKDRSKSSTAVFEGLFSKLFSAMDTHAGDDADHLVMATFAHHGTPFHIDDLGNHSAAWNPRPGYDASATITEIATLGHELYSQGFSEPSGPVLSQVSHFFAGLLQLADWLGSDQRVFEFWNGVDDTSRPEWARSAASEAIKRFGIDPSDHRSARAGGRPTIERTLGVENLHSAQRETMLSSGRLAILEAETGSGKTEAALARFFELFDQGAVDSLYFALPTRVAAKEIHQRVCKAVDRGFPPGSCPPVLLAIPGQVKMDGLVGLPQPDFGFSWEDDREHPEFWAAEHSKRFLAASIAVGTIDQILLGALRIKHSHMRAAAALRSLVVIDEVHASDTYMTEILDQWLQNHLASGGYALLLSATLGGQLRSRLLGRPTAPTLAEAIATPYPLLSTQTAENPIAASNRSKDVRVEPVVAMHSPDIIARMAISAASVGARVLVIRNTVAGAIAVMNEVMGHGAGRDLIWRVNGRPAMHHSRFSSGDRSLLDSEVQNVMGRNAPARGVIVIGTQTLEQSLDIDADLLITDLCPMDVLLQRIGRLHRHFRIDRLSDYSRARVILLIPDQADFDELAKKPAHGLGVADWGGVYPDLFVTMKTLEALTETPEISIPRDNRRLVEMALHPESVEGLARSLLHIPIWSAHYSMVRGKKVAAARAGRDAIYSHQTPFSDVKFVRDERIAARLGAMDRMVSAGDTPGPFAVPMGDLKVPHFLAYGIGDKPIVAISTDAEGAISVKIDGKDFRYDERGLQKIRKQ